MGRLFSDIVAKYVSNADDNLERIQDAILAAKGNVYSADRAASDAVSIWANLLDCWTASFDFGVDVPSHIEIFIVASAAASDAVVIKVPSGLGAPTKHDLQYYLNDNTADIVKGKVKVTPAAGPPATLTVKLQGLSNLKPGLYSGPLVIDEHVIMILVRVRP